MKAEAIEKVANKKSPEDVKKMINKFWASTILAIVIIIAGFAFLAHALTIVGVALLATSLYFLDLYRAVAKRQSEQKSASYKGAIVL